MSRLLLERYDRIAPADRRIGFDLSYELRADHRAHAQLVADLHDTSGPHRRHSCGYPVPVGGRSSLPGSITTVLVMVNSRASTGVSGAAIWQNEK